jgi:hypothetical protein
MENIEFFSDLPQAAIYTPTINYEPHLPIKGNTNASTTSKVFLWYR